MATIGTAIRLNDMMSSTLHDITDAMNMMLSTWTDLDDATSNGLDIRNVENIRSKLNQATNAIDQMEKEQKQFNREVREGSNAVDGLTDKILGAVSAYAGLQGLQQLVNLSDKYTQTQSRLSMIVDMPTMPENISAMEEMAIRQEQVDILNDKIFASAQRARAKYQDVADTVAKLSLNAGDAFGSNDETILFAENLNKLFAIAGTEQASIASASLQLTQALGSGVLRGEEFNAVFEAAPNIMQTVANYMDVPIGKLRQMAQDGQITADVVKNALLGATEEINTQFEGMDMTWAQVWNGVMNSLYHASIPLLNAINWLAQNWSVLQPIVLGVAAALAVYLLATKGVELATKAWSAAQGFLNNVMALNPIFIVIMAVILLISLIYAIVAAYNKWKDATVSATGIVVGAFMTAVAFIWNLFLGLVDLVLACVNYLVNPWIAFANFFGNLFNDPIGAIIHLFGDFADNILGVIESIAKALDKVFGSNLASAVQGWRSGLDEMVESAANKHGNGSYEKVAEELNLSSESLGLSRWAYGDAWDYGYDLGAGLEDKVGDMFGSGFDDQFSIDNLTEGIGEIPAFEEIANNTGDIKDSVEITSENLKYLRDLAEQDAVNRFTTAEIRVEMNNSNNISSNMDLDGVIDHMVTGVNEAMERVAEGVHN